VVRRGMQEQESRKLSIKSPSAYREVAVGGGGGMSAHRPQEFREKKKKTPVENNRGRKQSLSLTSRPLANLVLGVINSETAQNRRAAVRKSGDGRGNGVKKWRRRIKRTWGLLV